jgi:hypothetical protein
MLCPPLLTSHLALLRSRRATPVWATRADSVPKMIGYIRRATRGIVMI